MTKEHLNTMMFETACAGDIIKLRKALSAGADVNAEN